MPNSAILGTDVLRLLIFSTTTTDLPTSPDPPSQSVKMAPTKKKTRTGDTLNSRLALVMKSGKVVLGYKSTLKGKFNSTSTYTEDEYFLPSFSY